MSPALFKAGLNRVEAPVKHGWAPEISRVLVAPLFCFRDRVSLLELSAWDLLVGQAGFQLRTIPLPLHPIQHFLFC